ncbi:PAS domain S-box protein [Thiohalomonas denitrificans]|uniref:cyclic-guanylate-specific phosphodiesterase n=1 Tax=Thiohalomonas denitrificans TaxID=415747 RepID=A0A1G5QEC1_9GAMM|nr:PAS domain S-box protein [Thiohalomonas denitrificans]SCZ59946.1 PAS domain S-box-containing protein/diguanylate cyclase (GGDEF) domain-containing protein [Thiohalomonas denitrificans]
MRGQEPQLPDSTHIESERDDFPGRPPDLQRFRPRFILAFVGAVILLALAAYGIWNQQHTEALEQTWAELDAVVSNKSQQVTIWQEDRVSDMQLLLERESFRRTALQLLDGEDISLQQEGNLTESLQALAEQDRYETVQIVAADGTVVVEAGEVRGGRFSEDVDRTVESRQVYFSNYRRTDGGDQPVRFTLSIPLLKGNAVAGVLIVHIVPYVHFYPLLTAWPTASPTAELLLVSADNGQVVFISQLLEAEAPLALPRDTPGIVGAQAILEEGFFSGVDYRGEPVLAATRPVRFSPWALVAKIDQKEVFAPIDELAFHLTGIFLLILLGMTVAAASWWRKQQADFRAFRYWTALRERALARHFDYLTKYANDIILLTDNRGRIVEANDRAVETYGYGRDGLLGRHWGDLCHQGVTPLNRVSGEPPTPGEAERYENVHWRADGSEFPVEVSARAIQVEEAVYLQAIVRDITERKTAEARIRHLTNLYAALSETNQAIVRERDREYLLADICRIAVDYGGFRVAWIGMREDERLYTAASYGDIAPCSDLVLSLEAEVTGIPRLILGAMREDALQFSNDFGAEPAAVDGQVLVAAGGLRSGAALPLRQGGQPVGVLAVCARESGFFDAELLELLNEMALDISFAFDSFQLEANRRQAEAALRESEYRYRQLFNNMNSGVAVFQYRPERDDFVFSDVNKALERIEGANRVDVIDRSLADAFPGADAIGIPSALRRVWQSGEPLHLEPQFYRDDDTRGWREIWLYRLPTNEVVVVYDDVTEQIEAMRALRSSEERLRLALEGSRDGFWDIDFETGQSYFSERFTELFGYAPDELNKDLGSWEQLIHPEDLPQVKAALEAHLKGEVPQYRSEHRIQTKSGRVAWVLARGLVVRRGRDGRPLRMAGTLIDITERKQVEERLRLWAKVFESSSEGIFITDAERRIVLVNDAFSRVTGYSPAEAIGHDPHFLSSGRHDHAFFQAIWETIDEVGHWQGEIYDRRKDGEIYPEWMAISAVHDEQGKVINYVAMFSDISERKEAEARIDFLARHDLLTGLPNRRLLREWLEQAIAHASREGYRMAVLTVGVDHFKTINESLGHGAGDQILRELGEKLPGCTASDDIVARGGGDEFIVTLSRIKEPTDAVNFANCVRDTLSTPFGIDGTDVRMTTSIGVSVYPDDGNDVEVLIRNSGAALYHAKAQGRNNMQFFIPELNARARDRLVLENNLRTAVERDELTLYYQPQVNTVTQQLVGVEALLRWRRKEGIVMPSDFISVAEESGTMVAIGEWVLREACRQQRVWADDGVHITMAINVSAVQFHRPDFPDLFARILRETGADPACIEVEVTEGMLMRDVETTIRTLERLKAMGLGLSIDDFGTGYSSLSYLRRFPIDRLKVDQSFVRSMELNPADLTITEAIIGLGKNLGLRVIAEGVETGSEFSLLRGLECEDVQGYYFARPMPAKALSGWHREFTSRHGKPH